MHLCVYPSLDTMYSLCTNVHIIIMITCIYTCSQVRVGMYMHVYDNNSVDILCGMCGHVCEMFCLHCLQYGKVDLAVIKNVHVH